MKTLIFAIIALFSTACIAQDSTLTEEKHSHKTMKKEHKTPNSLVNVKWKSNGICFTEEHHQEVQLNHLDEKNDFPHFGYFVKFNEDGTFRNYYSAQCGNDCHVSLDGTYKMLDATTIQIHVDKIEYSGYCEKNQVLHPNKTYQYKIEKDGKKNDYRLVLKS